MGYMVAKFAFSPTRDDPLFDSGQDQGLQEAVEVPALDVSELVSQQEHGVFLVKGDCGYRKGLSLLGHGLGHVLLLEEDLVLELAVADRVEGQHSVDGDADQALVRVQEEDMLDLLLGVARKNLVPVAQEVGDDRVAIVTARGHDLAAHPDCH